MGLFAKSSEELYREAFHKGVLLGESQFPKAVALFDKAATKAKKENQWEIADKAAANGRLYDFLSRGQTMALHQLEDNLKGLNEIEEIGSEMRKMPVQPLLHEIRARLWERDYLSNAQYQEPPSRMKSLETLAKSFKYLMDQDLITYHWQPEREGGKSARERFLYYEGQLAITKSQVLADSDPDAAAQAAARALNSFKQGDYTQGIDPCHRQLQDLRMKRKCWVCQREFQGSGLHFAFYAVGMTPYVRETLESDPRAMASADLKTKTIVLCLVCSSSIKNLAKSMANQQLAGLKAEMERQFEQNRRMIDDLRAQIADEDG